MSKNKAHRDVDSYQFKYHIRCTYAKT